MRIMIWTVLAAILAGCATTPPPVISKSDAVARSRIVYASGAVVGKRVELPATSTGTGPHDFYNLFARFPATEAIYGISVATAAKISPSGARVIAEGTGELNIEGNQQLSAGLGNKFQYIEATFSRDFLMQAATNGTKIQISSSGASLSFAVPDWMYAALREVADENDLAGKVQRAYQEEQKAKQAVRDSYVKTHPDLPEKIKSAVLKGELVLGMKAADAKASWGAPEKINRTVGAFGTNEQWIFGDTYVYFDNDTLTSWQESR